MRELELSANYDDEFSSSCTHYNFEVPDGSLFGRYLLKTFASAGAHCDCSDASIIRHNDASLKPFITVITRTQGTRIEELREALLCLAAQSDTDFEVLLIGHKVSETQMEAINEVISSQPDWLEKRICFVAVAGGTRSHPLNVGFSFARGVYVSILDDDDLVFDNWIESFHRRALNSFGSVVFSYVLAQPWSVYKDAEGHRFLRAAGSPRPDYCSKYDPIRQLSINSCPTMGLAFPLFVFKECGIFFDETLTTTEDWDFLMRAADLCGVVESGATVAVYRIWENAESSRSLHDEEEWENNRLIIQDKFMEKPLLFSEDAAAKIVTHAGGVSRAVRADCSDMRLYPENGEGIAEALALAPSSFSYQSNDYTNIVTFDIDGEGWEGFHAVRFDPCENGMVTLESFKMDIEMDDGTELSYEPDDLEHNGIAVSNDSVAFIGRDPWLQTRVKNSDHVIRRVVVSYRLVYDVREDLLLGSRLVVRAKEKLRRFIRRMSR